MILQTSIIGEDTLTMSPTIVANKFFSDWERELQSVDYAESQVMKFFAMWFCQRYREPEAVEWLLTSRLKRVLQEKSAEYRSLSGK